MSSDKVQRMRRIVTPRGIVLLVVATIFFLVLYTQVLDPGVAYAPVITVDIDEILANVSYEQLQACPNLYRKFDPLAHERWPERSIALYQSPCPLGDFDDFHHVTNYDVCDTADVYMLVLVGSHPKHSELRDAIRDTWGQPRIAGFPFRLAFLFGQLTDGDQQTQLEEEGKQNGDILQGNFVDSYRNVTLRDLMGLRWAWQYCSQARFVMHADDDVSIDIYSVIDALEGGQFGQRRDFVACFQLMLNTPVLRTGKYTVTKAEHPSDTYDTYCQGWMYILSPHMAYSLDLAALRVPPYWMNDAYITGTLVHALRQSPSDLHVKYTINVPDMSAVLKRNADQPPLYTVEQTGANVSITYRLHSNYRRYANLVGLPKSNWTKQPQRRQRHRKTKQMALLLQHHVSAAANVTVGSDRDLPET